MNFMVPFETWRGNYLTILPNVLNCGVFFDRNCIQKRPKIRYIPITNEKLDSPIA